MTQVLTRVFQILAAVLVTILLFNFVIGTRWILDGSGIDIHASTLQQYMWKGALGEYQATWAAYTGNDGQDEAKAEQILWDSLKEE